MKFEEKHQKKEETETQFTTTRDKAKKAAERGRTEVLTSTAYRPQRPVRACAGRVKGLYDQPWGAQG